MTERYTGISENLKSTREEPGGAYGRHNSEGSRNTFSSSGQTREQRASARENIHNANMDMQKRFRASRRGTLEEIRDLLREQAIMQEIESNAAFAKNLDAALDRYREKTQKQAQEGKQKLTMGKLFLSLLLSILSLPIAAAEQTLEETKQRMRSQGDHGGANPTPEGRKADRAHAGRGHWHRARCEPL